MIGIGTNEMNQLIYAERLTAVRQQLAQWQVDGVLITSAANRRWLSGFTGSNGMLLVTADLALLATDSRYYERAKQEAPCFTLVPHERTREADKRFLRQERVRRMGVEQQHVTLAQAAQWRSLRLGVQWIPLHQTVEPLRQIKTAVEHDLMRRAAAITDQVIAQFPLLARPGVSEKVLAWELEKRMREAGADGLAFDLIVASGPNSALPHHSSGERPSQPGDAIIVDMGAALGGYASDLTRSFFLGSEPSAAYTAVYDLVLQAQTAVLTQARPGMTLREVDALARDVITTGGHGAHFGHGLGHGVGLQIHEDPFLSPRALETAVLQVGMNVTIEPGIYIPGWGGVRLEDFAVVGENGLELLSHSPKNPVILA